MALPWAWHPLQYHQTARVAVATCGDSELREEGLEKVFGSMMGMAANEEPFSYLHDMENRSDHEGG